MILACDRFTTLSPVPQVYTAPYSPMDYHRDAAMANAYPQESMHNFPQLPSPLIAPVQNTYTGPLSPRLSQFSNGSSDSDCASVFSDVSSASSASSTSSYHHITDLQKIAVPVAPQHQYVSPSPSGWYGIPSHLHRMANYLQSFQQHVPMPQVPVY